MNRAQRRAAENFARPTQPVAKPLISEAQLIANKQNAQQSTGPKTEAGKAISSHNAVKTALTGQTVLLATDDIAKYEELGRLLIAQHKPATAEENLLVQSLIDAEWRLMRIPSLELGIYAIGRLELADSVPAHLLEAQIYLKHERHLKNLHLQENRIRRYREADLKTLQALQGARLEAEAKRPQPQPKPVPAPENVFPSPMEIPREPVFKSAA